MDSSILSPVAPQVIDISPTINRYLNLISVYLELDAHSDSTCRTTPVKTLTCTSPVNGKCRLFVSGHWSTIATERLLYGLTLFDLQLCEQSHYPRERPRFDPDKRCWCWWENRHRSPFVQDIRYLRVYQTHGKRPLSSFPLTSSSYFEFYCDIQGESDDCINRLAKKDGIVTK